MNNINECNNNDDGLKSNEITQNIYKYITTIIDPLKDNIKSQNAEIKSLKDIIKSQNAEIKSQNAEIKSLKGKVESLKGAEELQKTEIESLKQELKGVKEDQRLLWCHFCLAANSRDIFKSIIYYLYTYLNLGGDLDNYRKLISIIKFLKEKNNNLSINNETLLKFLKLDNFLLRMFNLLLHRKFSFNNLRDLDKIKFIPKNTFDDCFSNLINFIKSIVPKDEIQIAIDETIKDFINDKNIDDFLMYEDGVIFTKINSKYIASITEKEIKSVQKFFKNITIDGKDFSHLCENKNWNEYENIEKPVYYFGNIRLDNNKENNNGNNIGSNDRDDNDKC
jgi:hypothetical protein